MSRFVYKKFIVSGVVCVLYFLNLVASLPHQYEVSPSPCVHQTTDTPSTDTYPRKNISYNTVHPNVTITTYTPWKAPKSCYLEPDKGPCRADMIRWFYTGDQNEACDEFLWGGCQGNGNNFVTKAECECTCVYGYMLHKVVVPPYCHLSFDYGYCFSTFTRWYYDKLYQKCKKTIYSGCGGNPNNFKTLEQCESACVYVSTYVTRPMNYWRRSAVVCPQMDEKK